VRPCVESADSWATLASLVHLSDVDDGSGPLVEIASACIGEVVDLADRTILHGFPLSTYTPLYIRT
jgi:hypothetical protein